ncbi:GREB1-related protein [Desulfovibrio sp. An276]|uniref:GREB1-related protein n=1 Tax=Desulfovibrio sp. An276 TaxID=1965618 RepID=UPI001184C4BB|nr:hypothetical protein [Desulfovibrio sp. An276]
MRHSSFACFVLTNRRPQNQQTLKSLRKQGYTGKIYLIVDNEDPTICEYKELYGDQVIVFDKEYAASITDRGDNIYKKNTVLFARNMCHKIAKDLGLEYFLELDDDYNNFQYRYPEKNILKSKIPNNLDEIFDIFLDFLDCSNALAVCFVQTGDLMGGAKTWNKTLIMRKAMNGYFCKTDRPYKFIGRMNDDVNTYVVLGHRGNLFLSIGDIAISQAPTQQNSGGLTEMYRENGTYMKSFYTVMMAPSAVKISVLGTSHVRIHHRINWKYCCPKILKESLRK